MDKLYIVMPAYNEQDNIESVVRAWYPILDGKDELSKMVVADSGSVDDTHEILLKLQKDFPKIEILSNTGKQHGPKVLALYAHAIREGADYIFQTDSDGQTSPEEFDYFWQLRKERDAVIGNRISRADGMDRKIVERIVCILLWLFFGVRVPDANAPFRLMKTEIVEKYIDKLSADYSLPNIMLTTFFVFYNENIQFVEISFRKRQGGENSVDFLKIMKTGLQAIRDFGQFRSRMAGGTDLSRAMKKNKEFFQNILLLLFMSAAAFILLLKSPLHIWKHGESGVDSSVFQTVALMMERGYMPYRDSFDHKGPLLYIINYIGRQISAYRGVWAVEFVSMVTTLLSLYRIARLKCNKVLSCFAVLTGISLIFGFFDGGNLTEEYALPFIAIALFIFLDYFINKIINSMRLILCGFCFGGVFLLRPNMISVWIVFCIAVLVDCFRRKEGRLLGTYILRFLIGTGGMIVPVAIWMIKNGILMECLKCYIHFNFLYTSSPEMALFPQKWQSFFYFFNNTVVILSVVVSIYLAVRTERFLYSIYICYIGCTLWLIALSGMEYGHYGMILVPVVVFPVASLLSECERRDKEEGSMVVLLAVLWLSGSIIMPDWLSGIGSVAKVYANRHEDSYSKVVEDVCFIIEEKTSSNEAISVYGSWDIIYLLSNRMHATRYSYQGPIDLIVPEIIDEYIEGLKKETPKIVVVQGGHYDDNISSFLAENHYELIWQEDKEERAAMIFERGMSGLMQ